MVSEFRPKRRHTAHRCGPGKAGALGLADGPAQTSGGALTQGLLSARDASSDGAASTRTLLLRAGEGQSPGPTPAARDCGQDAQTPVWGCADQGSPHTHSTWLQTHLPRNDASSACSAPQDKRELADLRQARSHDPLDVLTALRQEERQDQSCQNKLREHPC